jgi:ABC-type glycerol-3-phosphate transport system substrate-binding protein
MKKITGLFAVLAVLSMLSSGCGTTASSGGGTTPAYSGTITFDGTATATIEFDGGGTYMVNLNTGTVS